MTWFDRSGRLLAHLGAPYRGGTQLSPARSPDGHRVALFRTTTGNVDIWLLDVERGVPTRLIFDAGDDVLPRWFRDGSRIVFSSNAQRRSDYLAHRGDSELEALALTLATPHTNGGFR